MCLIIALIEAQTKSSKGFPDSRSKAQRGLTWSG